MPLIPWKYLTDYLPLSNYLPTKLGEKLTYHGLETKVIEKGSGTYLEFDTLPNRPDLLSWWGVIKEIGVVLNFQIKKPNLPTTEWNKQKVIEIENKVKSCSSFSLTLIKNIEIKESSPLIKEWLKLNNINSINNIIDIANLVMLESGQPLHIFDYDTLPEKKITIRKAHSGEKIKALNGQELTLNSEDVVINSGEKIIDLAGIIGVQETAVTSRTKNILIECAAFDSKIIKKTAKRLNLLTAASRFFSREASLLSPKEIINYAISAINSSCQVNLNSINSFFYWEEEKNPLIIIINQEFINKKTGQLMSEQIIEKAWQQLEFDYQKKENSYFVTVPLSRPDISSPEDLLEELLRIYDYNKLSISLPNDLSVSVSNEKKQKSEEWKRTLRSYLTNQGWQEIITYSLVSEEMKKEFEKEANYSYYQLLMPKNEHHKYYRQNLISSHLNTLKYNISHQNKNLFFFEISSVYGTSYKEEILILSGTGILLNQPIHKLIKETDFFWLKGTLENIFDLLRINSEISFFPNSSIELKGAEILLGKEKIGFLGQIESFIVEKYQINSQVFLTQLSLTKIFDYLNTSSSKFYYQPVSNFPVSERDLSFIFPNNVDYKEIIKKMNKITKKNLQEIKIFDIYQNSELSKEKKKSISFRLVFQSLTKTLESKEIDKMLKEIVENVEKEFAAKLRD